MKNNRFYISILWLILGVVLLGLGVAGVIDSFWSGMGGGFLGVGLTRVAQYIRYRKNEEYRERKDTEIKDERNKFIANKAWAWAGYCFVLIEGVLVIVFRLINREELMMMAAWNVCGIMVMYWICWIFLRKKY